MSETPSARPSGRDDLARREASRNYEAASHGGNWMVSSAFALALVWIGGALAGLYGLGGLGLLDTTPPPLLVTVAAAIIMPAALIVMAGYMARASRRAAAANALVLEAAARLMAPAREAGAEGISFAEDMKRSSAEIDRAMNHALTAMKAMAGEIGDERLRLESVSYAASDNARELAGRLNTEREALETLARDLRAQMATLSDAIPRQAELMVDSARAASEEVARADRALEGRLTEMARAAEDLTRRLEALDGLAKEAAARTDSLTFSIGRIEDKLDQSRRTVDAAVRASEVAAAAAATTGDALRDAVSSSLDGARRATAEINHAARASSEEAAAALARLREAASEARYAMRGLGLPPANGHAPKPVPAISASPEAPTPARREPAAPPAASPSLASRASSDEDLFEASAEAILSAAETRDDDEPPLILGREPDPRDDNPLMLRARFDDVPPTAPVPRRRASDFPVPYEARNGEAAPAWRDIISDLGTDHPPPPADRESLASAMVERLQTSGIPLKDVYKPKSKRRIAEASRKGSEARRREAASEAGKQAARVAQRLNGDERLAAMAREFVTLEREEALQALEQTQATARNASARLAAFLLVEAALSEA